MNKALQERINAIEAELVTLKYKYYAELEYEASIGKRTLLFSRGFKFKIERLEKGKARLLKTYDRQINKQTAYSRELTRKKRAWKEAEIKLSEAKQELIMHQSFSMNGLVTANAEVKKDRDELLARLSKARLLEANRRRYLNEFISRGA